MRAGATSEWKAKVAVWDRAKGYGFLQCGNQRVFLHRRDFVGPHLTPRIGEEILFTLDHDAYGRACARNAVSLRKGLGISLVSLLILVALLILPITACLKFKPSLDPRWLGAYAMLISALTYWMYSSDKRRAQSGEWRVPESKLHLLELLGGWPAAWLAQRRLRHKSSKFSYQVTYTFIVLGWQCAALDSLQDWRFARLAGERMASFASEFQTEQGLDPRSMRGVRSIKSNTSE